MPSVREAAFAVFAHFGVDALFGNPGSTELPMLKAMPDGIAYVLGLNEAVVVAMADGYAQATGRPALVNLHSAAGTGNALGSLFSAFKNGAPLVVTAGQQARSLLLSDPFLGADRATEFPRPYVKWAVEPARAEDVPAALVQAFHTALTPPMGPVFVSVPVDDWDRDCTMPALPALNLKTMPDPAGISRLAALLDGAERPALVLGSGIAHCGAWASAVALAETSGADVWMAPLAGRDAFPEDHPRFAGFLPGYRKRLVEQLDAYDAILVAGAGAFTWHAEDDGPSWPPHAKLGLLSHDPRHLATLTGGEGVLGDVAAGLGALATQVRARSRPPARSPIAPPPVDMTPPHILARVAALRPHDSILVEEAPTARGAMQSHLPITTPGGFFTTSAGALGYGLSAAIGVARGAPERKVVCLLGDGSSLYTIQGLWSAADQKANVSFLILNNRGYAALGNFAKRFGLNHLPGTVVEGIDFVGLSQSFGVPSRRVSSVEQLDAALIWSFGETGPTLIDFQLP